MDRIWWNHIIKANKIIQDVVDSAAQFKSVILMLPDNTPWKNTMEDIIQDKLKQINPNNSYEYFVASENKPAGELVFDKFCSVAEKDKYNRRKQSVAEFLGKNQNIVLNDRTIWVRSIPAEKAIEWISFVNDYCKYCISAKAKSPAIFILEIPDSAIVNNTYKHLTKISFSNNIDTYDRFAFCTLIASGNACRSYIRPYIAEIAANIGKNDIELSAMCVSYGEKLAENTLDVLEEIVYRGERSDGSQFEKDGIEDIADIIWETQIKYVFPCIERYRKEFILRYTNAIENELPIENSYGEAVTNPSEVEIGTLWYMVASGKIQPLSEDKEVLEMCRKARNQLAHNTVLPFSDVEYIMNRFFNP